MLSVPLRRILGNCLMLSKSWTFILYWPSIDKMHRASMRQILDLDTSREGFCPEAVIARTKFHLAKILQDQKASPEEAEELFESSRRTLRVLIETQSLDALKDVKDEHELALFDHLQPVFDGRFIGRDILRYLT